MPGAEDTSVLPHRGDTLTETLTIPARYHWGLMIGPRDEREDGRGTRFHAVERLVGPGRMQWEFEERLTATNMALVRIMVGKVANAARLVQTIRGVPVKQDDPQWNCVSWVRQVLQALEAQKKNGLGSSELGWTVVRDAAMRFCQEKRDQHRFDGTGTFDMSKIATFDLVEKRETVP